MKHVTRHSTLRDEPSGSDSKRNMKHEPGSFLFHNFQFTIPRLKGAYCG